MSYPDLSPPGLGVRVAVAEVLLPYPGLAQQDGAVVQSCAAATADVGGTSCVQSDVGDSVAGIAWFRSLNIEIMGVTVFRYHCVCYVLTCRGDS